MFSHLRRGGIPGVAGAGVSGTIRDRPSWAAASSSLFADERGRPTRGRERCNPVIWLREARSRRPVCLTGSCRCGTSVGERVKGRAGPFAPKLPCQRRIHRPGSARRSLPPCLFRDCCSVYTPSSSAGCLQDEPARRIARWRGSSSNADRRDQAVARASSSSLHSRRAFMREVRTRRLSYTLPDAEL